MDDAARLRQMLGETIPEGGVASDTLFSDSEIEDLLARAPDLSRAAYEGWRIKAAQYANLVNVTEGNAAREMGQLLEHAEKMVRIYLRGNPGPTDGRTRIGRIVRS